MPETAHDRHDSETSKEKCEATQVSHVSGSALSLISALTFQDDLSAFHHAHFGDAAIAQFGQTFLNPAVGASSDDPEELWEEEDELGYYDDGVKRTLTDDQIEMFRHSELKELRRKEEKAALKKDRQHQRKIDHPEREPEPVVDKAPLVESSMPSRFESTRKRKKQHRQPREPKPDLRKRTWDVVEKGLDTLDYD